MATRAQRVAGGSARGWCGVSHGVAGHERSQPDPEDAQVGVQQREVRHHAAARKEKSPGQVTRGGSGRVHVRQESEEEEERSHQEAQ